MSVFLRPNKKNLKNGQHYEFMDVFITVMDDAGFTAAKIVALLNQLRDAFSVEDRWYMVARSSKIIALREAADKRRDNFYGRLHAIIKAWAGSGIDQMDAAATSLKTVFDLYKVKTSAQIDEESGQLDNLISDLSDADMQAALQTLGISTLYDVMVTAHQETKGYRLEQGVEESEKVTGALKEARQTTDAIYDELTYLIEAFAKTADDPAPYEAFIKRWNGTLKLYPQPGKNKEGSGSSSSSQDSDDSGNSGNTGSQGNSGNAQEPGDTGNTGDSGDTGNTGNTGDSGNTGNTGDSGNTGNSGNTGGGDDSGNDPDNGME